MVVGVPGGQEEYRSYFLYCHRDHDSHLQIMIGAAFLPEPCRPMSGQVPGAEKVSQDA